ncbi:MAG TPA: hypothetical protein VHH34_11310 [Pseudonocardiaceae bacterium]|nr:hypothetical protein [Pseudonocardiaceae bacterium]
MRWPESADPARPTADNEAAPPIPDSDAAPDPAPAHAVPPPAAAPAPPAAAPVPAVEEPAPAQVQPAAPAPQPAAAAQRQDWGAADEGWRAAQALVTPAVDGEVTAAGLPRRTPRALLVPGAAGQTEQVAPVSAPVRSAELVRGRLSSYQRGIREGRQHRRAAASGSYQQQDAEEETK